MARSTVDYEPVRLTEVLLRKSLRKLAILGLGLMGVLVLFSLASGPAVADTPVSGLITANTTWTQAMSPIWVEGDITITSGATLTIDPGVEVRFNGFYDITVFDGALVADGDAAGAGVIRFTSNFTDPFPGAWDGLIFNGDLGNSILDDVIIEYAWVGVTFNGVSIPVSNARITDITLYGVYVSSSAVASYDLSFTGCTIANVGSYGMYFSSMIDTSLTLQISGCDFSSYGSAAVLFGSLQLADFDLTVESSTFNASNRAVYFSGTNLGDLDEGNTFRFTFNDNWLNSSFDSYGVYMPFDVYYFQETALEISGNTFIGLGGRSYGVYLDDFWGFSSADQRFTLQVTGNEFTDLVSTGVYFDQVWDIRNVTLTVSDNLFQNTDSVIMDYGVYTFWAPYYGLDTEDSQYVLAVEGNTVIDLDVAAFYIAASSTDGFKDVSVSISGNVFRNTRTFTTLDYGVYLPQFRFDDWSLPASFVLLVDGNTAENLDDYAVYFSSSISGFRTVDIDITGSTFENTDMAWMDTGVYFSSTPSYTTSYPGSFDLNVASNNFLNLSSYAIYLFSVSSFSTVTVGVSGNDFSGGSSYGLYMPGGVDSAADLSFTFSGNNADGIGNWVLYATDFNGLSLSQSSADFDVSGNTITDAPNGLYLGSINDYDLSNSVLVENNVLTDVTGTGIQLGSHDTTNSRVIVRSNIVNGETAIAIYLNAFQDQTATVDITSNTITGAGRGIYVGYPAYSSGDTTLNIVNNDILDVREYGIYIYEVYRAAAFINIQDNVIDAAQESFFSAGLIYFDAGSNGWYRSLVDLDISNNVLDSGLHGIYFYGTSGFGATVLVDITGLNVVDTAFGVTLDFPVGHAADIMNVRIMGSTFRNNHRGFLFINQPGQGLLPIDIQTTQVIDFGDWGGYAFFMGSNFGAIVQVDVRTSSFQAAPGSLGDVYAGFGPVTMNFYYIDSISTGVANDWDQFIRVLWNVDVEVFIGKGVDTPAQAGIVVYALDQFGVQSFISVTDSTGKVTGQYVPGVIISYAGGTSFAGPSVQTVVAEWGPFNSTTAATFSGNDTVRIHMTADNDADGLHDAVDPDDDNDGIPDDQDANPLAAGFLDYAAPPYSLHLWVLLGLIGAFVITLVIKLWKGGPLQIRRPPAPPEEAPMEESPPPLLRE